MPTTTHDIVAKLWNLCNVLKDDGVTYHQYVSDRCTLVVGILCHLPPTGKLFGKQSPLTAISAQISAAQSRSLDHGFQRWRQL